MRSAADDLCYVTNFKDESVPLALSLPAGTGRKLASEMAELVQSARRDLTRALDSADFQSKRDAIRHQMETARDQLITDAERQAREQNFALSLSPAGLSLTPLANGKQMTPQEFDALPEEERAKRREKANALGDMARSVLVHISHLESDAIAQVSQLDRQLAKDSIGHLVDGVRSSFSEYPHVIDYLAAAEENMILNHDDLRRPPEGANPGQPGSDVPVGRPRGGAVDSYRVNVIVDNGELVGAPVVFETNPTYYNLAGRVEYHVQLGALVTDYTMISAGALHRANGGFLVLDASDVLSNPFAWQALKRTLRTGQIQIENLGEQFAMAPTTSLRPQAGRRLSSRLSGWPTRPLLRALLSRRRISKALQNQSGLQFGHGSQR